MPTKQDLFGGSRLGVSWARDYPTPLSQTAAFEDYLGELTKSIDRHGEGRDYWPGTGPILKGVRPPKDYASRRDADMATLDQLTKSLSAEQLAMMSGQLQAMKENLAKDWDAGFPGTGYPFGGSLTGMPFEAQLAPVDLEGPAKLLIPRETPILNAMPRENDGIGSALQYRRILGWTNSGVGGVPDLLPFMASEYPTSQSSSNLPNFGGYASTGGASTGGLQLRRGQKISYASDAHNIAYTELSLSDVVSTKSYYIAQGYQDIRQLSATALLWAHKSGEERAMLYGRGASALGYTGPVSQPAAFTAANGVGSISSTTYYCLITAVASGGESVSSAAQQSVVVSTGGIVITWPALPSGATGFNLYVGTVTGGPYFFQAFYPAAYAGNSTTLASYTSTSVSLPSIAGTIDTTANPNGYDGLLTVLLNPALSGYVGTYAVASTAAATINSIGGVTLIGGTAPTPVGDKPWQTAFATMYGASTETGNYGASTGGAAAWPWAGAGAAYGQKLLARPQVVYVDGAVRSAMGQFVRTAAGGSTAYRITMPTQEATGGMEVGAIVNGIANQVTGDMVDFDVHPYMPVGTSVIWTKTLPFPDSEITNTIVAKNVQDYLYQMWPQIQFTYDASTYQLGTLVFYAPAWSGALVGLVP
jgi:hypothetical protein